MKADKMIPMATIGERCVICQQIFTKRHPKECRCICDKCAAKIGELIKAGGQNANEDTSR